MKDHYILGFSAFGHDASAALVRNGEVIITLEEERFNREKHSAVFPQQAIVQCLRYAGIQIDQVDALTFYLKPWLEISGNLSHVVRYFPSSLNLACAEFGGGARLTPINRNLKCLFVRQEFEKLFPGSKIPKLEFVEHHMAHAASAYYGSPFSSAAILSMDAKGEAAATVISRGGQAGITKLEEIRAPQSLGLLYAAMTSYLGFRPFVDEWKVMGLSAYGQPRYRDEFSRILKVSPRSYAIDLDFFHFHTRGPRQWFSNRFFELLGPGRNSNEELTQRHFDIAASFQKALEEAGVMLAKRAKELTGESQLCLAGGVALNILMNSRIVAEAGFDQVFIQPVAGDAGTSFGSAQFKYFSERPLAERRPFASPYLGTEFSDQEIELTLKAEGLSYQRSDQPWAVAAKAISEGKIVGWFQGRMEAGPRALGNRSILADPRRPDMKDRLNLRIKRRESFRPFAPSVCEEDASRYFETPRGLPSPCMILSGRTRTEHVSQLPAVTHVDGTARVHTVSRKTNPRFWNLLKEFERISGIPIVLNTSFNESEPIVESPKQAIDCFRRTKMDLLVIGDFVVALQ